MATRPAGQRALVRLVAVRSVETLAAAALAEVDKTGLDSAAVRARPMAHSAGPASVRADPCPAVVDSCWLPTRVAAAASRSVAPCRLSATRSRGCARKYARPSPVA